MTTTDYGVPSAAWAFRCLELLKHEGPHLIIVPTEAEVTPLVEDLRALAPERTVIDYHDDEHHPYSPLTPNPRGAWSRLGLLARLSVGETVDIIVSAAATIGRSVPSLETLQSTSLLLAVGEELKRDDLLAHLERAGYHRTPLVEDPGTASLRGSVVDLWPPGERRPVRTDFFGDTIETIRSFDPLTQRQGEALEFLVVPPARAYAVGPKIAAAQRQKLLELSDELELPSAHFVTAWQRLEAGVRYPGIEGLEPYLRAGSTSLLELLPRRATLLICAPEAVTQALVDVDLQLAQAFADRRLEELVAPPEAHRLSSEQIQAQLRRRASVALTSALSPSDEQPRYDDLTELQRDLIVASRSALSDERDALAPLLESIKRWRAQHMSVVILSDEERRRERLVRQLSERGLSVRAVDDRAPWLPNEELNSLRDPKVAVYLGRGALRRGLIDRQRLLVVIPEHLINGRRRSARGQRPNQFNTTLAELTAGQPVVHLDFGIGRYQGIERRRIDGLEHDFIRVDFRGDDKVFVPVARIGVLRPYDGGGAPTLDKLGGSAWTKRCARVRKGLLEIAHRLVETQAKRDAFEVKPLPDAGQLARQFEALFPFQPTADQEDAFDAIAKDLASSQPMDRLVCGDVGFGKTEVAMRAAFAAVAAGQQVAVLVPTTVLCQQHVRSFSERFGAVGARVASLSRLNATAETKETLEGLRIGQIDVVIGTHKLLGRAVQFKDLSLLIVDEEQRFGVRHKERIKELCQGVNVLTMTATPIPRTMQLAMLGVRQLSTITTPPSARRAVRTTVCRYEEQMVREVILREFERGGQVFFLHNRVQDLDAVCARLQAIIPEARVGVAHGQMNPADADAAMIAFIRGQTNLLVCTTIIESGLDIPNANTILVHRADRFGLAQLHQIRGRVGRRQERGYCYLLLRQDEDLLSVDAQRRLEALRRFTELGSGIRIAREDLDLRGAGNLIGADQSGHIEAVGIELYSELLREAIARVKGGQINTLSNIEIKPGRPAVIPHDFMPDAAERISLYDRLARASEDRIIAQLAEELEDRYGQLPDEVEALFLCAQIRWRAGQLGASQVQATAQGAGEHYKLTLALTLDGTEGGIDPTTLVRWVAERPQQARLTASNRLIWTPLPKQIARVEGDPARAALNFCETLCALQPERSD